MPLVERRIEVRAPIDRVFDLARDIDLHRTSMRQYGEEVIGGVTTGLIGEGEEVALRARHFGLSWRLTSRVTEFRPPVFFRDTLVSGPFARFDHAHTFAEHEGVTVMTDRFDYEPRFGVLGRFADRIAGRRRLTRLLEERQRAIKEAAERRNPALN
jgi:ligand-binding SRPBCC domain-containing protein